MIVKGPGAGLLVDEVHALAVFVVGHAVLLAVVRKLICGTRDVRERDVRQYPDRRSRKSTGRNYSVRKHTLRTGGTTLYVVRLSIGNRVSQPSRQSLSPKRSVYTPGQGIVVAVKKITWAEGAIPLVNIGHLHETGACANHLASALI